jgi:hypothetical protein
LNKNNNVDDITKDIADLAYSNSKDRNFVSPFEKKAKQNGKKFKGGKQDDITVIVAQIAQSCETLNHSDVTSASDNSL